MKLFSIYFDSNYPFPFFLLAHFLPLLPSFLRTTLSFFLYLFLLLSRNPFYFLLTLPLAQRLLSSFFTITVGHLPSACLIVNFFPPRQNLVAWLLFIWLTIEPTQPTLFFTSFGFNRESPFKRHYAIMQGHSRTTSCQTTLFKVKYYRCCHKLCDGVYGFEFRHS